MSEKIVVEKKNAMDQKVSLAQAGAVPQATTGIAHSLPKTSNKDFGGKIPPLPRSELKRRGFLRP